MAKDQPWKDKGMKKAEWLAEEVAKAVGAGKPWNCETVDFSDPNRPPTCIEVDFPIIPINQIAAIEGNAGKPIYQMSKWWARRRSSVFRAMLLASAIKAPDDPSEAAKLVWNAYYGNHQKNGAFKHLKVADIFMGGGTTIVEGSRLGMQMYGNDLNPVAWFIVKNAMAQVDKKDVEALLADIEAEVKPQIMPFYTCDCPRGHKGKWTQISTGEIMGDEFDPLALKPEQRKEYQYEGPEIIYVFWAKHGPCQVTGCGHRTPIMSSPLMATKTLSVKTWAQKCEYCGNHYDLEERDARMAPGVPLVVAETERPFAVLNPNRRPNDPESAMCPCCGKVEKFTKLRNGKRKKVELSLLVHPQWLQGEPGRDKERRPYGGSADDPVENTIRWNEARAAKCRLIEVRGKLSDEVTCPDTGIRINTGKKGGTSHKRGHFTCGGCGKEQNVREATKTYHKIAPIANYAIEGYCPHCSENGELGRGRFFHEAKISKSIDSATLEWETRKLSDLDQWWPRESINIGHEIGRHDVEDHHYTHWHYLFNPRQLITHATLLRFFAESSRSAEAINFVMGVFQQFLRNQCMFSFWHISKGHFAPAFSNSNFNPKACSIEVGTFSNVGYGPWPSTTKSLIETIDWLSNPWEILPISLLPDGFSDLRNAVTTKSQKVITSDHVMDAIVTCGSSTELGHIPDNSLKLVITDPPFSSLEQYAEMSDFFYVWLNKFFKGSHAGFFSGCETPKSLEAVSNKARHPEDPEGFYNRLLSACWKEAHRMLAPGGILAFTFHHSEDKPWVSVLESLFDAGFFLVAVYPIRGDESKGDGQFGSQKVEFDMIHVCRKLSHESAPISWAKLRRQVLRDVRDLQNLLEHHQKEGLPEADLQVIRRGKALEYFSRHYGKVYKDLDTPMTVLEALLGINQLLDEEAGGIKEPPPHNAEPFTRMLLRLFDGISELPRDQIQKFLRGTGSAPSDYATRGWIYEEKKVFYLSPPQDLARSWVGKQRKGMTSDYDQAMFFIGACFEGSGINANDTLNNANFRPHPALGAILIWFKNHGANSPTRNAAILASQLYHNWESKNQPKVKQLSLFDNLGEEEF